MALHSLTTMILLSRQAADMENDPLCDDTEITGYLNDAREKFYLEYTKAFNDAYLTSFAFTIAAGQTTAPIPSITGGATADFLASRGLDFFLNGQWRPVGHFTWRERNSYHSGRRAHRVDSLIRLDPIDIDQSGSYRIWYTPKPPQFVVGTDTLDTIEDLYFSFHVDYAAWRMLIKAKLPDAAGAQQTGMASVIAGMQEDAKNRDSEPEQAPDIDSQDPYGPEWGF